MLSALKGWLVAFFFTQLFELPIYWRATRALRVPGQEGGVAHSLRVGFLASAMTHPVVWFVFPVLMGFGVRYWVMVVAAEVFAVVAEAVWLHESGVPRAFWWSLGANAFSASCGFALRELTGIL